MRKLLLSEFQLWQFHEEELKTSVASGFTSCSWVDVTDPVVASIRGLLSLLGGGDLF